MHTTTKSGTYAVDAAGSIGDTTIAVDDGAGALPTAPTVGDVFTIAGSTQQYSLVSRIAGATEETWTIFPALDQAIADGDAITILDGHRLNLAFHRDAITFASRPNADRPVTDSVLYRLITDPLTGVVLDLRIQDYHRQTAWSIGCLWGVTVMPLKEGAIVRIMG